MREALGTIQRVLLRAGALIGVAIVLVVGVALFGGLVGALIIGTVDLVSRADSAWESAGSTCDDTKTLGGRAKGALPQNKVVLIPTNSEVTWSFDASRDAVPVPVVITASPPLTGLAPEGIEIIPTGLLRADNHERLPSDVTYSGLRISRNGERIQFDICVDPRGAEAGRYVGDMFVNTVRPNVAGATLHLVVTARSPEWFGLGLGFMLVAIVGVLTLKGIADYRRAIGGTTTTGDLATEFKWRDAVKYIWRWDELRLISSLIGLFTALFVGFRVYNTDRTWGDDAYQDSVALIAAAITAVGAQGIFDGFRGTATK